MIIHAEHTAMFAGIAYQSSTARPCPRVVAGLRCLRLPPPCMCRSHTHVLDHAHIWRASDGHLILAAEPDTLDRDELARFVHDLASLDLEATLTATVHRHPALLIVVRRRRILKELEHHQ